MLVDSGNSAAGSAVNGAIRQASQATGTSFNYLLATAQVESGLNPQAGAATSSARGLFQFIDSTWLAVMKQAGPTLGYGRYADAITQSANGQYEVRDPSLRREILNLRSDPTANAVLAGAFTKANAAALGERLGRSPSEGELYIAHFLGAGGAARLITLAATNPSAKAADFFAGPAQANPSIFYDRTTGAARSVAQVRDILTARYNVARNGQDRSGTAVAAATPAASAPAPDTAGLATAYASASTAEPPAGAAETSKPTPVFHALFADPNRSGPLAPMVSALWGAPAAAAAATGDGRKPQANPVLNLFRDAPA